MYFLENSESFLSPSFPMSQVGTALLLMRTGCVWRGDLVASVFCYWIIFNSL